MKYFLHDTGAFDDEKITELYLKFGYEGLGLFYTALEKIARQEKPIKTQILKSQLKVGKHLQKCWSFMEEIGILSSTNGETFNEQLMNFSEKYKIKKEKTRKKVEEWRKGQEITKNVTNYVPKCNHDKVKESKIKESKSIDNTTSGNPEADFIDQIINSFAIQYEKNRGVEYLIIAKGKERAAAGKLLGISKKKYTDKDSEWILGMLSKYFNQCINIQDDWLNKNMSLPILVSKFNEINNILRNGNKRAGITDDRLAEIIFDSFAKDK